MAKLSPRMAFLSFLRTNGSNFPHPLWRLEALPRVFLVLSLVFLSLAGPALAQDEEEEPGSCFKCHSVEATGEGVPEGKRLDRALFLDSLHGDSCLNCHDGADQIPHVGEFVQPDCSMCHPDVAESFTKTPHGLLGDKAPSCADCHSPHAVFYKDEERSSVNKLRLTKTCEKCHGKTGGHGPGQAPQVVADYSQSVHGVALLEKKNTKAAGCSDCHSIHTMKPRIDPTSNLFKPNIPKLCAQCHAEIAKKYEASIHGVALTKKGRMDAPSCTDCHSEHAIRSAKDPTSTVNSLNVSKGCASCHESERIARRFGLSVNQVATYSASFHGLAEKGGYAAAANCASCHGVHEILPSTDPASKIHKNNLLKTCQECHQGAAAGFIDGKVHAWEDPSEAKAAYFVKIFYYLLIPLVLGGMLLHNLVIISKFLREKYKKEKEGPTFLRFQRFELILHGSLILSFSTLAVTGFALTFPDQAWAKLLVAMGMTEPVRAWIHRVAAVVLTLVSVFHIGFSLFTRHGRYAILARLPRLKDLKDVIQNLSFHLGWAKEAPRFDRYDYTTKMEYWALVWGNLVMMVTGAMLWWKLELSINLPRWWVYVAERIHFYEAILAVAAIIIWHLFFVIFHPHQFPMSLAWLTGRVTLEEMEHMHPVEWERLKDSEYLEKKPAEVEAEPAPEAEPEPEPKASSEEAEQSEK